MRPRVLPRQEEPPTLDEHINTIIERTRSGEMAWNPLNGDRRRPNDPGYASKLVVGSTELPVELYKVPTVSSYTDFFMFYMGDEQKNSMYAPVKTLGQLVFPQK